VFVADGACVKLGLGPSRVSMAASRSQVNDINLDATSRFDCSAARPAAAAAVLGPMCVCVSVCLRDLCAYDAKHGVQ